ncbi:MAG: multicopper oxidase family protein [Candidatus Gracilibacteria bacterium]|nr:multicopper oxidase family protein [Candidatus Gracilibacteria bacterium]
MKKDIVNKYLYIIIGLLTLIIIILIGSFTYWFTDIYAMFMGGNMMHNNRVVNSGIDNGKIMGNYNGISDDSNSINQNIDNNLPDAKKIEIVELKNGDTYTMEVTKVEKEIGNYKVVMLAYNGTIPGPVLKVEKNSEITLKFVNKVKGLETTLHSHGLRLDNEMDGVPKDMGGKQDIMKYGDTFEYKLKFQDEGVYWYHPHVREDLQQELGLYGNYIVSPTKSDYWSKTNREEVIVLDDILMDNGKIEGFSNDFANYTIMGRYGNTMMINGDTNYKLSVKKGEVLKMYFTNVSNTRVYNINIPNAKIKLVGGDLGKYEREEFIDNFLISPAERYIVDVYFDKAGEYFIQNKTPDKTYNLGKVIVSDDIISNLYKDDFLKLKENPDKISEINDYKKYFDKKIDKNLTLALGMKGMGNMNRMGGMGNMMGNQENGQGGIEWEDSMYAMNKNSNSQMMDWKLIDSDTKKENMDINWKFKVGDKVKVHIYNDPNGPHPMQHPIHFHGQRFLILSENGKETTNKVWKDTVLVKSGEYVDILLDISNSGDWMSHCHIAEHLSSGMMMSFEVE